MMTPSARRSVPRSDGVDAVGKRDPPDGTLAADVDQKAVVAQAGEAPGDGPDLGGPCQQALALGDLDALERSDAPSWCPE